MPFPIYYFVLMISVGFLTYLITGDIDKYYQSVNCKEQINSKDNRPHYFA